MGQEWESRVVLRRKWRGHWEREQPAIHQALSRVTHAINTSSPSHIIINRASDICIGQEVEVPARGPQEYVIQVGLEDRVGG